MTRFCKKGKTLRFLVAAAWISVFLLGCDGRDPVVGDDNNGEQRTEEGEQQTEEGEQQTEEGEQRTEVGDRAQLVEMRREIDALVGDAEGASIADCRYAGLGSKPCGGPWEYIVYSVSSTDSTALVQRLTAYEAFEAEMNMRYGYVSDCSVPAMPVLAFTNGRCIAE